jgi:hypothetical protein
LVIVLGVATITWTAAAYAQQTDKVARVGVLSSALDNPISGPRDIKF